MVSHPHPSIATTHLTHLTSQAPKTNCTPAKLAAALTYIQKSRACHTIKDLEKHLPSVAQINGMQVKGTLKPAITSHRIASLTYLSSRPNMLTH
jgi:hypothetical protein